VPLLGGVVVDGEVVVLGEVVVAGDVVLLGGAPTVGEAPAGGHGDVTEALVPFVSVVLLPVAVVPVVLEEVPEPTWLLPVPT
jgi:hypothetical protein